MTEAGAIVLRPVSIASHASTPEQEAEILDVTGHVRKEYAAERRR